MLDEIPLTGGRDTVGVVRVGDTVRRPSKPSSPFVATLLLHLDRRGFAGAPRYLGQDEHGRDCLSYISGSVPAKFRYFDEAQIAEAGRLLRAFHDATRGSELAAGLPVVCHHDPGPNNTVFDAGEPVAFLDFDYAAPGEPLEDVGYMAWTWCVSSKPDRGPVSLQAAQVRVLADAYGLDAAGRGGLVDAVLERQSRNARFWSGRLGCFDGPPTSRDTIEERVNWSRRERAYVMVHRDVFEAALH